MAIMEYDLTIQYIKGEANNVADYLSRESFMAINVQDTLLENAFPATGFPPYKIERFPDFYNDSEKLRTIENGKLRTPTGVRVYVPQLIREKLLQVFHEHPLIGNHLSFDKVSGKFKAIFYWPSMDKLMIDTWQSCQTCQFNKEQPSRLVETHLKHIKRPNSAWQTLNADFLHVDNEYVFVMVDEYSKFVITSVCKKQNGPTLKNILMKCFTSLGFPEILRTDNGPAFISKTVTEYLQTAGVTQQFSSPHNHKSNAFVERFYRTLRDAIRIHKGSPLLTVVSHFVYAYNHSRSKSTGLSPAQILLNIPDRILQDESIHNGLSGIHALIKDTKDQFNDPELSRKGIKVNVGDLILRKVMHRKDTATSIKNQPRWEGPFKIIQRLYGDTYEILRLGKRHTRLSYEKCHAERMKRYIPTSTSTQ
uniref:RNA-directed DNA polymerase n=1 Tax=Strongyloides venezuelensis TaxID=75913 RepID=A0A0K0F2A1_STRVS